MSICNWSNLPEGVVTLVASKFDGQRKDVIRALRGVCKPWRADISVAVTKATIPKGSEAPVWQVLQTTPKLRSLTVVEASEEQCKTLLAEIRIVKKLVPELDSFVFDDCELDQCRMPLSECLGKSTRELTLMNCGFEYYSIDRFCDFQRLTSLNTNVCETYLRNNDFYLRFWRVIFTELPSLQVLCLEGFQICLSTLTVAPNLPNLTSLTLTDCDIHNPDFLRGLPCLEHLDLDRTHFTESDLVNQLPVSITSLKICNSEYGKSMILPEGFARLASRLPLLSALHLGCDDKVTDDVLKTIASMPSLTRLSVVDCIHVTDTGISNLTRSKLEYLEIQDCPNTTHECVYALRAAASAIDIIYE